MKSVGVKPLDTLTVYRYGVVRLPASFVPSLKQRLAVRCLRGKLSIFPATNGELGFKPQQSPGQSSVMLNLSRVFRNANVDPAKVAGEYTPRIDKGVLKINLK